MQLKLKLFYVVRIIRNSTISLYRQNVVWKVCPRLRQKQTERMDVPQTPLVGTHAFTHYYHPATIILLPSCFLPPTQNPVWNSAEQRTIALYPDSFLVACNTIVPRLFLVKERPWVWGYCTLFCMFLTLTLPWAEEEMNMGIRLRVQWIYSYVPVPCRNQRLFCRISLPSKCRIAELPLRAGLIRTCMNI